MAIFYLQLFCTSTNTSNLNNYSINTANISIFSRNILNICKHNIDILISALDTLSTS